MYKFCVFSLWHSLLILAEICKATQMLPIQNKKLAQYSTDAGDWSVLTEN